MDLTKKKEVWKQRASYSFVNFDPTKTLPMLVKHCTALPNDIELGF
jgi:hypothetical protein